MGSLESVHDWISMIYCPKEKQEGAKNDLLETPASTEKGEESMEYISTQAVLLEK